MSCEKILILGSNGFIGKNLEEYFISQAGYKVLAPKRQELNLLDTVAVYDCVARYRPDFVIHSAVNIRSVEDNLQMYFNVERCSSLFGKMVTIGSGAEYDMKNYKPMMDESYFKQHIPSDAYGLSKYVVSNDVEKQYRNIVNLRVFGIFGKYEDYTRRFISNNICKAICGQGVSLYQNMKFDFLYINDFIRILESLLGKEQNYRNYNVCTSSPLELVEIAGVISDTIGLERKDISVGEPGFKPEYSGNNSRLLSELGDFSFTDIRKSVAELYQWYLSSVDKDEICRQLKTS